MLLRPVNRSRCAALQLHCPRPSFRQRSALRCNFCEAIHADPRHWSVPRRTTWPSVNQAPRQRLKRAGTMSTAAQASPPKAVSAGVSAGFSTPSKRTSSEVDGPAVAVKKRRRSTAEAPPPPPRDVTCGVCLEPVAAACKPSSCGHLLCQTCAYGLWCCPQCRAVRP